ncbi:hypothetical protein Hanom_Chr14g01293491 [Helianthus anomalus]
MNHRYCTMFFLLLILFNFQRFLFFSFRDRDELSANRYWYRKYRLQYWYMKVKTGSEPVPRMPKVGTELVFMIFRFGKFGIDTQYYLLISDYGFHTNNTIIIKKIWLIFFWLSFSIFFLHFLFCSSQRSCAQQALEV